MAKIVQSLTRAEAEYNQTNLQSLVRDLDSVIKKLNTTFQQEVKQEIEAKSFFLEVSWSSAGPTAATTRASA